MNGGVATWGITCDIRRNELRCFGYSKVVETPSEETVPSLRGPDSESRSLLPRPPGHSNAGYYGPVYVLVRAIAQLTTQSPPSSIVQALGRIFSVCPPFFHWVVFARSPCHAGNGFAGHAEQAARP